MTNVSEQMIEAALNAWFASPPSENDMGLARSMKAALTAALAAQQDLREAGPTKSPGSPVNCSK